MGLLTNLRLSPLEQYDFAFGTKAHRRAHAALRDGDSEVAAKLADDRGGDVEGDCLAWLEPPIPIARFEEWVARELTSASLSELGAAQIRDAWANRGAVDATPGQPKATPLFYAGLETAEATLERAITLDDHASSPWTLLLISGRGLSLGNDILSARFDEAHHRAAFSTRACTGLLECMTPAWGGSVEEMLAFARWILAMAPHDAEAQVVLPRAHIEAALDHADRVADGFDSYLARRTVQQELSNAADRFLEAIPTAAPIAALAPLNAFARAIRPTSVRGATLVRELIRRIDGRLTAYPWSIDGDPAPTYQRLSREYVAIARRYCGW